MCKKILAFYINVSTNSPDKIKAFIEEEKNKFNESCKLPKEVSLVFIPVRNGDSRLELINFIRG